MMFLPERLTIDLTEKFKIDLPKKLIIVHFVDFDADKLKKRHSPHMWNHSPNLNDSTDLASASVNFFNLSASKSKKCTVVNFSGRSILPAAALNHPAAPAAPETMDLLGMAILNISYVRKLFPGNYFNDKSVPALVMKFKDLMPKDAESSRMIDWMERGQ